MIDPPADPDHTLYTPSTDAPLNEETNYDAPPTPVAPASGPPDGDATQYPRPGMPQGPTDRTASDLSDYEIIERIARGGMGVVYKARHRKLNRVCALKMIQGCEFAGPEAVARFENEARLAAKLDHPNIVPIYEIGEHDGKPFFTMQLIDSGNLSERLSEGPLPARVAVQVLADVASAVHFAHVEGIVHRDLKPQNILLHSLAPRTGSVAIPPTGSSTPGTRNTSLWHPFRSQTTLPAIWALTPKVADFGLAKLAEGGAGMSLTGDVLGTPQYMPPEQAAGKVHEVGPRSDVYSLGAVLYACLTGRPPFQSPSRQETLMQVLSQDPISPRKFNSSVSRDLETIVLHCLQKEPSKRYASAWEVEQDLRCYLAGEPIVARPIGFVERFVKLVRRRPAAALFYACITLAIVAVTVGITWAQRRQEQARVLARAETLVGSLPTLETSGVARVVEELRGYRDEARPFVDAMRANNPRGSRAWLHATIAAVRDQPGLVPELMDHLLRAQPEELVPIREALRPYLVEVLPRLWKTFEDTAADPDCRLRAAATIAGLEEVDENRWSPHANFLVERFTAENPLLAAFWAKSLEPAKRILAPALAGVLADSRRLATRRDLVADLLAEYAAEMPEILAEQLRESESGHHNLFLAKLTRHRDIALRSLRAELTTGRDGPARRTSTSRQANAAVALFQLGDLESVWPWLRHSADPTVRSLLVHRLAERQADPFQLLDRLEKEPDLSAQRALILSLGEFDEKQLPAAARQAHVEKFLTAFRDHPDAGLHSSLDWLLRQRWGQGKRLQEIERDAAGKAAGPKRWFVAGNGMTFSVFDGPIETQAGSPVTEADRDEENEGQHRARIPRSFAVATRETTIRQFLAFQPAFEKSAEFRTTARYSPDRDGPVVGVKWYDAAAFCNWLSEREGIPRDQWCYLPDPKNGYGPGMRMAEDFLRRTGYRLTTEAEWEHAARAGAETPWFFGSARELVGQYSYYIHNAQDRAWPCGQKKPNDFGLFDVMGNAWEWCQDELEPYPEGSSRDDLSRSLVLTMDRLRTLRGGSFFLQPSLIRSSVRFKFQPVFWSISIGFRPARTLPNP